MVFARNIDGQELTFGVSGKLIMNAVVMYDHQTDTLWSQFLMEGVQGPLMGTTMELLPAQLTTWEAWVQQHPDTLALDKRGLRGSSGRDPYDSYYASGLAGILGESNPDGCPGGKEFVVGLDNRRVQRAYPFRYLSDTPVLNDSYDDTPIVVTFDLAGYATAVFSREVGGRTLTFDALDDRQAGQPLMRDQETGTTWERLTGAALTGELQGDALTQVPSFQNFWFSWTDFHHGTELYEP